MFAVKNSMNRREAPSPASSMTAGRASNPSRASRAGGATTIPFPMPSSCRVDQIPARRDSLEPKRRVAAVPPPEPSAYHNVLYDSSTGVLCTTGLPGPAANAIMVLAANSMLGGLPLD